MEMFITPTITRNSFITLQIAIYFKTPRKCALFGFCCQAIPHQVNFLIDENVLTGKGANSTIS